MCKAWCILGAYFCGPCVLFSVMFVACVATYACCAECDVWPVTWDIADVTADVAGPRGQLPDAPGSSDQRTGGLAARPMVRVSHPHGQLYG